jgi:hypothetical protein
VEFTVEIDGTGRAKAVNVTGPGCYYANFFLCFLTCWVLLFRWRRLSRPSKAPLPLSG